MPVLKNARHEKFAIAIADGKTLAKALETAGYKPHASAGNRLLKKVHISSRVDEIKQAFAQQSATAKVYDRELLMGYLERALAMANDLEKPTAAVQAVVAMGRIQGLIIDRREVGDAGAFDAFTDEELVSAAAKKARELGIEGPKLVVDEDEEEPETPIKGVASTG